MIGIGIDVGGTNTKLVALNKTGKVLKEDRFKTLADRGYADFIKRLSKIILFWKKELPDNDFIIGAGVAGDINSKEGIIRFSPNLKWRNIKMAGDIKKRTGIKCIIENDANMAAWGSYVMDLKRKYKTGMTLTMGTGIGCGLIINGELYSGACGSAGELGHTKIYPGGEKCHCQMNGCVEAYTGSYAIIRRAKREIKNPLSFIDKYSVNKKKKLNTPCLTNAAARGNKTALKIWRDTGKYLGMVLSDLILVFNPEYIVLTGGVSKASKYFMPAIKDVFCSQKIKTPFRKVKLLACKNADIGCLGAAFFALEKR